MKTFDDDDEKNPTSRDLHHRRLRGLRDLWAAVTADMPDLELPVDGPDPVSPPKDTSP